jgi:hypothetical protein
LPWKLELGIWNLMFCAKILKLKSLMKNLYIKTKFGLKEIVDSDRAAKMLKIKPSTLSAYLTREQLYIKRIRIKNLIFFYRDDIDKLIEYKNSNKKGSHKTLDLFS